MNGRVWWQKTAGLCTFLRTWLELDHRCWWRLLRYVNNGWSCYRRNPTNPYWVNDKIPFSHVYTSSQTHANRRARYKQTPTQRLRSWWWLWPACQVVLACYIISPETERDGGRGGSGTLCLLLGYMVVRGMWNTMEVFVPCHPATT